MDSDNEWPGDWRLVAASQLAYDLPAAYPGGPSHKKGTLISLSSVVTGTDGKRYSFSTPSSAAMALNLSIRAADRANVLRRQLVWTEVPGPEGPVQLVDSTAVLFDLLEQNMAAAMFAFHAIEAYANYSISFHLKGTLNVRLRKKSLDLTSVEIERMASTEEKVGQVLPAIMRIASPKGTQKWQRFLKLQEVRNSTTHLKHSDQTGGGPAPLFYSYLNEEPLEYAKIALGIVDHFHTAHTPRWAAEIRSRLS